MITRIKLGGKIKCLVCDEIINLTKETFRLTVNGEYIKCPHCGKMLDTIVYHKLGTVVVDTLEDDNA